VEVERVPPRRLPAALDYAGRGWPVFLLGRTERPVANCPDCRLAGTDHDREACPYPGRPARHPHRYRVGLFIVDIDPRQGGRIEPALMTPTATVATGGAAGTCTAAIPAAGSSGTDCPDTPVSTSSTTPATSSPRP
jgi:hypothetical protein